jgi:hypothetical protein
MFVRGTLAGTLFVVVGLMSLGVAAPGHPSLPDPDIVIRFRGLMVFGEVQSGREVVRLHSRAPSHKVTVQIKGPKFGDFVEWGPTYAENADMKLEVTNEDGTIPANSAGWVSSDRPFQIASRLHPESVDLGRLVFLEATFLPTFTVNAGQLYCTDEMSVKFENKKDTQTFPNVPKEVVAEIRLGVGQKAKLTGGTAMYPLPQIPLVKPNSGEKWEIIVRVNPTLLDVCDHYHFKHYYMGFVRRKKGVDTPVDPDEQYAAKSDIEDECGKTHFDRVIPARPCVPLGY